MEFQVLGETHRVLGAGDLLLSQPSPLVLFPPCSLPCPKVSPGTQEAASEAPNSPPTVRRRGRNRSLLKGLRPPMMQATLLDTTVRGPVGCGQPSEGGSLRWVVAGGGGDSKGGGTEIDNTGKNQAQTSQGQCYSPHWLDMKGKGYILVYQLNLHPSQGSDIVTGGSVADYG